MQKRRILVIVLALGILVVWRYIKKEKAIEYQHITGTTMGTVPYSIKYLDKENRNLKLKIDSILVDFNQSLSTYIPDSEISKFNREDTIQMTSTYLKTMLAISKEIYTKSNGAYDPTIGPLINAWGFGPKGKTNLDSLTVDSLLSKVGFEKVNFTSKTATKEKNIVLSFSASAKGYGVDVIASYLKTFNINDFMIEIGGEVVCEGKNERNQYWKIGIETPDMRQVTGNPFATTFVKNMALATSGNYRNYYRENDKIISHTISPYTGYPIRRNLLSASIFAPTCALADGYATACMVLGTQKSIELIETNPELEGFLIFSSNGNELEYYTSEGISQQIQILD